MRAVGRLFVSLNHLVKFDLASALYYFSLLSSFSRPPLSSRFVMNVDVGVENASESTSAPTSPVWTLWPWVS